MSWWPQSSCVDHPHSWGQVPSPLTVFAPLELASSCTCTLLTVFWELSPVAEGASHPHTESPRIGKRDLSLDMGGPSVETEEGLAAGAGLHENEPT